MTLIRKMNSRPHSRPYPLKQPVRSLPQKLRENQKFASQPKKKIVSFNKWLNTNKQEYTTNLSKLGYSEIDTVNRYDTDAIIY